MEEEPYDPWSHLLFMTLTMIFPYLNVEIGCRAVNDCLILVRQCKSRYKHVILQD